MLATQLKEREPSFDLLKGVLMTLVVLSHLFDSYLKTTALFVDALMPIFFVILCRSLH